MNFNTAGTSEGIRKGLQNAQQGMLQAEQIKQNKQNQAQSSNQQNLQIQQLQMQLQQMESKQAKEESYNAFSAYRESGDTKFLNNAIKGNPQLSRTYSNFASLDSTASYTDEALTSFNFDTKLIKADPNRFVVKTTLEGKKELVDMNTLYAVTGYMNVMKKEELDELARKASEYKLSTAEADSKVAGIELKDMEDYLASNPNATLADYNSQLKGTQGPVASKPQFQEDVIKLEQAQASGTSLTKDQEIELRYKKRYLASDSDEKRDIITKGMDITSKYMNNLEDIDQQDIIDLKLANQQAGIKPNTTVTTTLKDSYKVLENGKRLAEHINSVSDEEISRGIVDQGVSWFTRKFSDTEFRKLDEDTQQKELLSATTDSKLGNFLASYIKSISGTAVAEAEYIRLAKVLKGGTDLDNIQMLKTSLNTFVSDLDKEFNTALNTNYLDSPVTVLDLKSKYKESGMQDFYSNVKIPQTSEQKSELKSKFTVNKVYSLGGKKYKVTEIGSDGNPSKYEEVK